MALLTLHDIELAFGHVALLDRVSLAIERGERIGLIGRNGEGKSSLLSLIAGRRTPDDGAIVRASATSIALVEQDPQLPDGSVLEAITSGLPAAADVVAYERVAARLAEHTTSNETEAAMAALAAVQARLDAANGWAVAHRLEDAMHRFRLAGDSRIDALSGGQRKRVALARAMVAAPDLLLLDEPTNHLDIATIGWLESLLVDFDGSVLFVTHDRAFLDAVATRIVELDRGRLTSYPGDYATYRRRKAEELEVERVEHAKFDKRLAQEEAWIRQGIEARRTRNEGRVRRLEQLRVERSARRERTSDVRLAVDTGQRSGKRVAELSHVTKSFAASDDASSARKVVVRDFSTTIQRGDRVGLIGENGAGKTTLLRLILGDLEPDEGVVKRGTQLSVAYFDQGRAALDPDKTLLETISPGSDWIEIANGSNAGGGVERKHVMSYLGDFLFAPERARSPVKSLSGGERNRLLLARLFARPANVLVLDEPTNDLDVDTLELLEALLTDYRGTLFLVSHDRAFLDNVVTQTIAHEGDGRWREYAGGHADVEAARARARASTASTAGRASAARPSSSAGTATAGRGSPSVPATARKLGFKERRELEGLPDTIERLETEQSSISQRLEDGALYRDDPVEAARLQARSTAIEAELASAMERWDALERLAAAH